MAVNLTGAKNEGDAWYQASRLGNQGQKSARPVALRRCGHDFCIFFGLKRRLWGKESWPFYRCLYYDGAGWINDLNYFYASPGLMNLFRRSFRFIARVGKREQATHEDG
jgi:hypothetical protein